MNLKKLAQDLPLDKQGFVDYFFSVALIQTLRPDCTRRRVGCIAVSPNNRIVACGYNAPPTGELSFVQKCHGNIPKDHDCCKKIGSKSNSGYDNCNSLHAEMNCLNEIGTRNQYRYIDLYLVGRDGKTGELTNVHPPCILCSRLIKQYNVRYIHCLHTDGSYNVLTKGDLRTTL